MSERFPRVASLRTAAGLRARLAALALDLPCDDEVLAVEDSPLARSLAVDAARVLTQASQDRRHCPGNLHQWAAPRRPSDSGYRSRGNDR